MNPLLTASKVGNAAMVDLLLSISDALGNTEGRTQTNDTALHLAAARGFEDIAKLLIKYNANCALRNGNGKTASQLAYNAGYDALGYLLEQEALRMAEEQRARELGGIELESNNKELFAACLARDQGRLAALLSNCPPSPVDLNCHLGTDGSTPLIECCRSGALELITLLANAKCDANATDGAGATALHHLAAHLQTAMSVEAARILVTKGRAIPTLAHAKNGITPLHAAVAHGNKPMVTYLLSLSKVKKTIDAQTSGGSTALHLAVGVGSTDIATLLIESGASTDMKNDQGLDVEALAEKNGFPLLAERVRRLYDELQVFRAQQTLVEKEKEKFMDAIKSDDVPEIEKILKGGFCAADVVFEVNEQEFTVLYVAIENGAEQSLRVLLAAGAHPNLFPTLMPAPPLHRACDFVDVSHFAMVKMLLAAKADLSVRDRNRMQPLHRAVAAGNFPVVSHFVSLLDETGQPVVDLSTDCSEGNTALHIAARNGDTPILRELLVGGADPLVRNDDKLLAVDLTTKPEDRRLLQRVIETCIARGLSSGVATGTDPRGQSGGMSGEKVLGEPVASVSEMVSTVVVVTDVLRSVVNKAFMAYVNLKKSESERTQTLKVESDAFTLDEVAEATFALKKGNLAGVASVLGDSSSNPEAIVESVKAHAAVVAQTSEKQGMSPDEVKSFSMLIEATVTGDIGQVRDLVEAGVPINVTNEVKKKEMFFFPGFCVSGDCLFFIPLFAPKSTDTPKKKPQLSQPRGVWVTCDNTDSRSED